MSFNSKNYSNYGATNVDPEVVIHPSNSREISILCENVSSNIEKINTCIRYFTTVGEQIGTQKDTHGLRDQILVKIMSSNHLVKASQSDISKLNNLSRGANKQSKLQIQKLTEHFKDVVERNCQTQQAVVNKLKSNTLVASDKMMDSGDQTSFLETDQLQIQKNLEFENEMLLERQERIKQIENQIIDANELMREISALIYDQGTAVDTIESLVENVNENVQMGNEELTTAMNYATRARKRKFILLSILIIVLTVLIGIIIWSSTS